MKQLNRLWHDVQKVHRGKILSEKYNHLFESGLPKIAKKVGEEGVEIAVAAMSDEDQRDLVAMESADLLCYLTALWVELDIREEDIEEALLQAREKFDLPE